MVETVLILLLDNFKIVVLVQKISFNVTNSGPYKIYHFPWEILVATLLSNLLKFDSLNEMFYNKTVIHKIHSFRIPVVNLKLNPI